MGLTDLTQMDLPGETITLPIGGRNVVFRSPPAWLYRAVSQATTTGRLDERVMPDDRDADEFRHLLGEHYDEMQKLSGPQWDHLVLTLTSWVVFGNAAAERVWERRTSPEGTAPAARSSAGASASTGSTSGTSTPTGPRSKAKRKRRR